MSIDWFNPAVLAAWVAFVGAVGAFLLRQYFERKSINRAVLAEIRRLVVVIKKHRDFWDQCIKASDTQHPLIPFSHAVYSKQVRNIGVLNTDLVANAVHFYGYVDFLNALQASRKEYIAYGKSADFDKRYLESLDHCVNLGQEFAEQFQKMRIPPIT